MSATAFDPNHSITAAANIRANDLSLDIFCDDIVATPLPLFNSHTTIIEPLDVDFNRIGIVLESLDAYLIFIHPIDNTTKDKGPLCGWLSKGRIGSYLVMEWESLPKKRIGMTFIAAMGETGETGEMRDGWNVHGKWITGLRKYAGDFTMHFGLELELHRRRAMEAGAKLPSRDQVGRFVTERVEKGVSKKVRDLVKARKERTEKEEEESRSAMKEFLDFGDD